FACSHHITPHREWSNNFKKNEEVVYIADETPLTTHGIGSVRLQNEEGTIMTLKGVRYSPKLKKNLIFVGTLESKGFEGRMVVGTIAAVTDGDRNLEAVKLWHMRLEHAGEKSLNLLIKQGLLKGLSSDLRKAYEKCNHIPQESRALIDTFLKEGSDKDYELNLSMYKKAAKLEKQMNAKLAWIHEKYNHRSETHIGGSSSQTHEIGDVYLIAKELHQILLNEETLRETLEEQTMDEKTLEEKIRQKQADDDEYFMEFGNVIEDVGEDDDFNSGSWVSATNYVNAFGGTVTICLEDIDNFLKKGKIKQVVVIVKSCFPNALGDLNVTLKDLSRTVFGTIHYKVLDVGSYEKDITVGDAMILANVSVLLLTINALP
nr:retrovirus-related Pol polyprotein from transposon TNT 1-94 [Tanacetum cinerariifolium]